ncbi:MAG: cadherin repeat domain-containing protein, partial [Porticoccaceae bacterium]
SDLFIPPTTSPTADTDDFDNDASTDSYVLASWTSLFGSWPNSVPADLMTLTFDIAEGATGMSAINFTTSSNAAGFAFDGQSHDVVISAESEPSEPESMSSQLSIDAATGIVTLAGEADYQTVSNYNFTVTANNGADSASQDVGLVVADALVTSDSYQGTDDADVIALDTGSATVASGNGEDVIAIAQSLDEWSASAHTLTDFDSSTDTIDVSAALLAVGYTGLSSIEGVEENQLNQMTNVSTEVLDLISNNDSSLDNAFGSYFDDATNVLTIFADSDSSAGSSSIESIEISVEGDSTVEEDDLTLTAFIA